MKNSFDRDVHAMHYVSVGLSLPDYIVFHSVKLEFLYIIL